MGKVEDQRAMREAKYAGTKLTKPVASAIPSDELCGFTSIGKKRCIRPKGHSETSHKYRSSP